MRVYFDVDDVNAGTRGCASSAAMRVTRCRARDGLVAHRTDVAGNQFGLWQNDPSA